MQAVKFEPATGYKGTPEQHKAEQQEFLLDRYAHWNNRVEFFRDRGDEKNAIFAQGLAKEFEKAWHQVDRGLNPFGSRSLEDGQPESACSGQNCELKAAGIEVSELMEAKK